MSTKSYQVILSTDGKHTVIATTDDPESVDAMTEWATKAYESVLERYGRKGESAPRASVPAAKPATEPGSGNSSGNGSTIKRVVKELWDEAKSQLTYPGSSAPYCKIHGTAMVPVEGKYGLFWSCHERTADGQYCKYRPLSRP